MRLISWNIRAGGGTRRAALVKAAINLEPDIVTFQEVRGASVKEFRELFAETSLKYFKDSFPRCDLGSGYPGRMS